MLEGPDSRETEEDKECVITPSTSVKFNAALRERNRVNFMRNHLLLIGRRLAAEARTFNGCCTNTAPCWLLSSNHPNLVCCLF